MEKEADPLVRMSLDVHLSTKNRFRDKCARQDVTMAEVARSLLEGYLQADEQKEPA